MIDVDKIIRAAIQKGASDIHLVTGQHPMFRISKALIPYEEVDKLKDEEMFEISDFIINGNVDKAKMYDETRKLFSQYNTRLDLMSYNNNVSHTQNSPQTTTKTEENFDFMRKNIKHEDKTLKQRMTETLLPLITFILLILAFSGISAFFGK